MRTLLTVTASSLVGTFTREGIYTRFRAAGSDTNYIGILTESGGHVVYALLGGGSVYVGRWA